MDWKGAPPSCCRHSSKTECRARRFAVVSDQPASKHQIFPQSSWHVDVYLSRCFIGFHCHFCSFQGKWPLLFGGYPPSPSLARCKISKDLCRLRSLIPFHSAPAARRGISLASKTLRAFILPKVWMTTLLVFPLLGQAITALYAMTKSLPSNGMDLASFFEAYTNASSPEPLQRML